MSEQAFGHDVDLFFFSLGIILTAFSKEFLQTFCSCPTSFNCSVLLAGNHFLSIEMGNLFDVASVREGDPLGAKCTVMQMTALMRQRT